MDFPTGPCPNHHHASIGVHNDAAVGSGREHLGTSPPHTRHDRWRWMAEPIGTTGAEHDGARAQRRQECRRRGRRAAMVRGLQYDQR